MINFDRTDSPSLNAGFHSGINFITRSISLRISSVSPSILTSDNDQSISIIKFNFTLISF